MTSNGVLQILVFFGAILLTTKPVGLFMSRLFQGERTFLHPVLRPIEALVYKLCGVREDQEQRWTHYAASLLAFSIMSFVFVYIFQRLQGHLPLNPQGFGTAQVPPDLAFNTAISFMTNTNWQAYSGESTLSYLVQMVALAVQNFVSAAVGLAVAIALIRGFARQETDKLGNFWVDLTRGTLYVLIPIAIVSALVFCSQGVIQNFHGYTAARTVEGATQTIAQGPVASQEAIKQLGTNGGGFFNGNSAHPFESPNPFTNLVQIFLIFVLSAGLTYTFGHMVKDTRQGWALFAAMAVMFLAGVFVAYPAEQAGNPILSKLGVESAATATQSGGNMEGKALRDPGVGAVRHGDDRRELRRRQQHARQLHADRWPGAAVQPANR
jgi:K+-transporting ATPase ATPase A chain